jgi:hypothetical protein
MKNKNTNSPIDQVLAALAHDEDEEYENYGYLIGVVAGFILACVLYIFAV